MVGVSYEAFDAAQLEESLKRISRLHIVLASPRSWVCLKSEFVKCVNNWVRIIA